MFSEHDWGIHHPFYRDAWVVKRIYGHELVVPANLEVGALTSPTETFTIKDSMNEHPKNAAEVSCYSRMDPFGLALENFDVFGRWSDTYSTSILTETTIEKNVEGKTQKTVHIAGKYEAITRVDVSTVHQDGRPISGIEGLKNLILEDKDKIAKNVLTKLFEYAMGRKMIYRLLDASKKNDYKLRDLIVSIIADAFFTTRYREGM